MKLEGSRLLHARRERVWAMLNDPEVLRRCIAGCEQLTQTSPNQLAAVVALKIGPIAARFKGEVTLSEIVPPERYRISGKGTGGPVGEASGGANVQLTQQDDGTLLAYVVDANVSGKIAQLGQRLIDATARQLADRFFDRLAEEVGTSEQPAAASPAAASRPAGPAGASSWWRWGLAAIAAIIVLALLKYAIG